MGCRGEFVIGGGIGGGLAGCGGVNGPGGGSSAPTTLSLLGGL